MKLIKENFSSAIEDREQRIAAYKARHLKEEKEILTGDVDEKIFQITYRYSPEIFSSFMIKADSEEDARGKAEVKTKGKEIVGVKLMSKDEVHDMKNRGMSIVENVEVDKDDKGRLLIVDYREGKKDLKTLHKELLDLFNGDYKQAFEFFVTNEDVKLKESEETPLREDVEIEIDMEKEEAPSEVHEEEEEVVTEGYQYTKYTSDDGRIVKVTYEGGKSFILNYNNFEITVVDDGTTYTIGALDFVQVD